MITCAGFRGFRPEIIASWLIRCRGQFKDFELSRKSGRAKSNHRSGNRLSVQPQFDDTMFASEAEYEAAMLEMKEKLTGPRLRFSSMHRKDTQEYQDDYDDWLLEDLKRTQRF